MLIAKVGGDIKIMEYDLADKNILCIDDAVPCITTGGIKARAAKDPSAHDPEKDFVLTSNALNKINPNNLRGKLQNAIDAVDTNYNLLYKGFNTLSQIQEVINDYDSFKKQNSLVKKIYDEYNEVLIDNTKPLQNLLLNYKLNYYDKLNDSLQIQDNLAKWPTKEPFTTYQKAILTYLKSYTDKRFENMNIDNATFNNTSEAKKALDDLDKASDVIRDAILKYEKKSETTYYQSSHDNIIFKLYDNTAKSWTGLVYSNKNMVSQILLDKINKPWRAQSQKIIDRLIKNPPVGLKLKHYNILFNESYKQLIQEFNTQVEEDSKYTVEKCPSYKPILEICKILDANINELETDAELIEFNQAKTDILKLHKIVTDRLNIDIPDIITNLRHAAVKQKSVIADFKYTHNGLEHAKFLKGLNQALKLFNTSQIKKKNSTAQENYNRFLSNSLPSYFNYHFIINKLIDVKNQNDISIQMGKNITDAIDSVVLVVKSIFRKNIEAALKPVMERYKKEIDECVAKYTQDNKSIIDDIPETQALAGEIINYINDYNNYLNNKGPIPKLDRVNNEITTICATIEKTLPEHIQPYENLLQNLDETLTQDFLSLSELNYQPIHYSMGKIKELYKNYPKEFDRDNPMPGILYITASIKFFGDINDEIKKLVDIRISTGKEPNKKELNKYIDALNQIGADSDNLFKTPKQESKKFIYTFIQELLILCDYVKENIYSDKVNDITSVIQKLANDNLLIFSIQPLDSSKYNSQIIKTFVNAYNQQISQSNPAFDDKDKHALIMQLNSISDYNEIYNYSKDLKILYKKIDNRIWDIKEFIARVYNPFNARYTICGPNIVNSFTNPKIYYFGQFLKHYNKDEWAHKCRVLKIIISISQELKKINDSMEISHDLILRRTWQVGKEKSKLEASTALLAKYHSDPLKTSEEKKTITEENAKNQNKYDNANKKLINAQKSIKSLKTNANSYITFVHEAKVLFDTYRDQINNVASAILTSLFEKKYDNKLFNNNLCNYLPTDDLKKLAFPIHYFIHYKYADILQNLSFNYKAQINKPTIPSFAPDEILSKTYNFYPFMNLKPDADIKLITQALTYIGIPPNDEDLKKIESELSRIIVHKIQTNADQLSLFRSVINEYKNFVQFFNIKKLTRITKLSNIKNKDNSKIISILLNNYFVPTKFYFVTQSKYNKEITNAYNNCVNWINRNPCKPTTHIALNNGPGRTKIDNKYYYNLWEYNSETQELYDNDDQNEYKKLYVALITELNKIKKEQEGIILRKIIKQDICDLDDIITNKFGDEDFQKAKDQTYDMKQCMIPELEKYTEIEKYPIQIINKIHTKAITELNSTKVLNASQYKKFLWQSAEYKILKDWIAAEVNENKTNDNNRIDLVRQIFINLITPFIKDSTHQLHFLYQTKPLININNLLSPIVQILSINIDIQFKNDDINDIISSYNNYIKIPFNNSDDTSDDTSDDIDFTNAVKEFDLKKIPKIDTLNLTEDDFENLSELYNELFRIQTTTSLQLIENLGGIPEDILSELPESASSIPSLTYTPQPLKSVDLYKFKIYMMKYNILDNQTNINSEKYYTRPENNFAKRTIILTSDANPKFLAKGMSGTQGALEVLSGRPLNLNLIGPGAIMRTELIYENTTPDRKYTDKFDEENKKENKLFNQPYGSVLYTSKDPNSKYNILGVYPILGRNYSVSKNKTEEENL